MKRFFLILLAIAISAPSCDNFSDQSRLQQIRELEYQRTFDRSRFVSWLNADAPEVRQKALIALGRIQDSSTALMIFNRNIDPDPQVRQAAAVALGMLESSSAEGYLLDFLRNETDKETRLRLIDGLGKSGTQNAFLPLRDFLEGTEDDYLQHSILAHYNLARDGVLPPSFNVQLMTHHLKGGTANVRWRSGLALGAATKLWTFFDFEEMLADSNELVKHAVLTGLNQMVERIFNNERFAQFQRENRSDPNLQKLLRTYNSRRFGNKIVALLQDSVSFVRVAAIELLARIGRPEFQSEIVKMLQDPNPNVQIVAMRAMENFRNVRWYTRRESRRVYNDTENWQLKGEALRILALVQPAEALTHVKEDYMELEWPFNYYAIPVLENIETDARGQVLAEAEEATRLLIQLAESDNIAVATLAMEVLVNRFNQPADEYFFEKLKQHDVAMTTIIAKLMQLKRSTEAVKPLIEAYGSFNAPRDLEPMEAIIVALDSIGDASASEFLTSQAGSRHQKIRESARRALITITGEENPVTTAPPAAAASLKWDFKPVSSDSVYRVTFFTRTGDFTIRLFPETAPANVANIVSLVNEGFYNDIYFHRVVPGYVTQTGDPRGDGWGGPGYAAPCEYSDIPFNRGVVGIAHAGKDTGNSQFFVAHTPQPHLTGRYTAIGVVEKGMQIIDRITVMDKIINADLQVTAIRQAIQ